MAVMLIGIVVLRWHAFVALILAAVTVAALTPTTTRLRTELRDHAVQLETGDVDNGTLNDQAIGRHSLTPGGYLVLPADSNYWQPKLDDPAQKVYLNFIAGGDRGVVKPSSASAPLKPGDWLIPVDAAKVALNQSGRSVGNRVADGFGDTCQKVGILIAMAAIIGQCLLRSGGAERIIDATCSLLGERRTSLGFVLSGFVLAIPVFFDTVFYLLMPLARALYRRTHKNYLLYVLSVVVGGSMAHSLVPPTPGPLLVASELNIDLGVALPAGLIVGLIAAAAGYGFAVVSNQRWSVHPEFEAKPAESVTAPLAGPMPALGFSLLPVLLPLVLLTLGADWASLTGSSSTPMHNDWWGKTLDFISDKNIALTLSALAAMALLAKSPRRGDQSIATDVSRALSDAGSIILITSAGGALGQTIRETGIAEVLASQMPTRGSGLALLWVGFGLTTLIRFVQGSATVAMITAVGIVGPLAMTLELPYHAVYLYLAIGCGSKPLPWMNDSGFWVVGRMAGMTTAETLCSFSATLTVMGVAGFAATLIGAMWWPLV